MAVTAGAQQGDRAERVFVLERGWVLITSLAPGGREIVLGLRGPGDLTGELSALDGAPRSATAFAVGVVEATVAPSSALIRALSDAATAMDLLRVLASRLRDADRKRLEFAALDTLGRVAWRLQELSERFVKALSTLRSLGCIATSRRSVLVRDIAGLRRHAYGEV